MGTSVPDVTVPAAVYEVGGRRFEIESAGFAAAISDAHASRLRPRCMCMEDGVEMYVARLAGLHGSYIVKRMPETGSRHAADCSSYEPPADCSGLGQVLGSAIIEDTTTGKTTLRLDFLLTKMSGRSQMPSASEDCDRVASNGTRLSLRGLLHYLWDQAELTRWHPGFAGKRTWGTVRKQLLLAAEDKITRGGSLQSRLYIPELFSVEQRDAISTRRTARWARAVAAAAGKQQHLMLLIGEVKELAPGRYGFKAVVKHVPDLAFALDERLYRRLCRRFESELALWSATEDIHMVMVATFTVAALGLPSIVELSLMPVTRQWLPIDNVFEHQVIEQLVADRRAFIKGLRYNLRRDQQVATATLTDAGSNEPTMYVLPHGEKTATAEQSVGAGVNGNTSAWVWTPASSAMPPFPPLRSYHVTRGPAHS